MWEQSESLVSSCICLCHGACHDVHRAAYSGPAAPTSPATLDEKGNPRFDKNSERLLRGKYSLHALRHCFCSWPIERGKPLKEVQAQMGHSSATMTLDRYGHLFPRTDDALEMAAAEAALLGPAVAGR